MEVSGQIHAPTALPSRKGPPGTPWIGGWVGIRAGLVAGWGEKFPTLTGTRTPDHSARSPALYHWAVPPPRCLHVTGWSGVRNKTLWEGIDVTSTVLRNRGNKMLGWYGHVEGMKEQGLPKSILHYVSLGAFAASELDEVFSVYQPRSVYVLYRRFDDHHGHGCRNVGTILTPNAADSPRRLHQVYCTDHRQEEGVGRKRRMRR
jgi:hypothetical protein